MNPGTVTEEINGISGFDPTFGMPAIWVRSEQKTEAEMLGYTIVDAVSVMVTHLTETIKESSHEILTREDAQQLVDKVKEHAPTVVAELVPDVLGLGEVQSVLQNLLRERIPIRNLPAILEVLADHGKKVKDPDQLTELVRQRLGRVLCEIHGGKSKALACIVIDPQLEGAIEGELIGQSTGEMSAAVLQRIQENAAENFTAAIQAGHDPVILTRVSIRRYVADMLYGLKPRIPVLSYNEVSYASKVEPVGQISITSTEERVPLELGA